ncbi:hypothetical protein SEA_ZANELLA_35 [Microbacterium phage Zanella]|nr:hypothetical protein SEA_ZANELLA_35 [Microbacterium phage Zanella]
MSTITAKTFRDGKPCGFCTTGARHDLCPGGVLNGDRATVVLCGCTEHELVYRCLDCGLRSNEEVGDDTWQCLDQEACAARRAKSREKSLVALYGSSDTENPLRAVPRAEKPEKAPSRPKVGKCLCCGETTGGGRFRPGHDSKYLTMVIGAVREHQATVEGIAEIMAQEGCSEALVAKFRKRVAA